ncbi:MAG: DUF3127 domain-containing protein [Bacteroidia bacterium]|nr:DUF3127 domain-containing protein [Bacteroidia bacterium]
MGFTLIGKIIEIFPEIEIKPGFTKREFVVEYTENPKYPQLIKFETIQERCSQLDLFNIGDEVEIQFNLKGREWINPKGEKVYFTSLEALRINAIRPVLPSTPSVSTSYTTMSNFPDDDELPF